MGAEPPMATFVRPRWGRRRGPATAGKLGEGTVAFPMTSPFARATGWDAPAAHVTPEPEAVNVAAESWSHEQSYRLRE